jgi:transcriptional regulator with XRE-family HTH domain
MRTFAEILREEREKQGFYLRQVAAALEIDQAIISKFEKGDRKPSREQVIKLADFFGIDKDKLITLWLSDKILYTIQGEKNAKNALKVAEQQIKYKSGKDDRK